MRRLHPQNFVRHVVLSSGTTMFQEIGERMTKVPYGLEDLSCLSPYFQQMKGECDESVPPSSTDVRMNVLYFRFSYQRDCVPAFMI